MVKYADETIRNDSSPQPGSQPASHLGEADL
jgi:hypothetical protein